MYLFLVEIHFWSASLPPSGGAAASRLPTVLGAGVLSISTEVKRLDFPGARSRVDLISTFSGTFLLRCPPLPPHLCVFTLTFAVWRRRNLSRRPADDSGHGTSYEEMHAEVRKCVLARRE